MSRLEERALKRITALALAASLTACAAADTGPTPTITTSTPAPVVPTSPAVLPWGGSISSATPPSRDMGANWTGTRAWIGASPGTLIDGSRVTIRSPRASGASWVALVEQGGFDPIAVPGVPGDSLQIDISSGGGSVSRRVAVVPLVSGPIVLRTEPSAGASDVSLQTRLKVVFSEPLLSAPGDVQLTANGSPVSGDLTDYLPSTEVEFVPAVALSVGTAYQLVITDSARGYNGRVMNPGARPFTTMRVPGPATLKVESFSVIEFQYPNNSWTWYAPLVRVSETGGLGSADIVKMSFNNMKTAICNPGFQIAPLQTMDLFTEIYGDYAFEISFGTAPMSDRQVSLTIVYRDDAARLDSTTVVGPVIPGALPTTYTGGTATWTMHRC